jgi:hypothetical protein
MNIIEEFNDLLVQRVREEVPQHTVRQYTQYIRYQRFVD